MMEQLESLRSDKKICVLFNFGFPSCTHLISCGFFEHWKPSGVSHKVSESQFGSGISLGDINGNLVLC